MIEFYIKNYIEETVCELYNLPETQILVTITGSRMDYSKAKRYNYIGDDIISVTVHVKTDDFIDKTSFIRAFKRKVVELNSKKIIQKYLRCTQMNYVEVVGIKEITFYLEFTQTITIMES